MSTKRIITLLIISMLVAMVPMSHISASDNSNSRDSVFGISNLSYSVTPADEAWRTMSVSEKRAACDFSEDQLINLNTDQLLRLAMDYPLSHTYGFYDRLEDGLQMLVDTSNVYRMILERDDLSKSICRYYDIYSRDPNEILVMDLLAAHLWKHGQMSEEELQILMDQQTDDESVLFGDELHWMILDFSDSSSESVYEETRTDGFSGGGNTITNENGALCQVGIYTKYGTSATAYKYLSGEYTGPEITYQNAVMSYTWPTWNKCEDASKKYNCHSYCWIDQANTNIYWIVYPLNYALSSSYFTPHSNNSAISTGDKILLYSSSSLKHSAIAFSNSSGTTAYARMTSTSVRSKVGSYGVYQTNLYDLYQLYGCSYYTAYTP